MKIKIISTLFTDEGDTYMGFTVTHHVVEVASLTANCEIVSLLEKWSTMDGNFIDSDRIGDIMDEATDQLADLFRTEKNVHSLFTVAELITALVDMQRSGFECFEWQVD